MAVREVAFELECFEWADERLEVAGRWKGLGAKALNRPVLTVETEGGRRKHLVAMPGGHFGAAEESWRAAFDWPGDPGEITGAELEVGGKIVVDLPLPDRKRRRRRRPPADTGDELLRSEVAALRGQVERLRSELAGRERENMQLREQIDVDEEGEPLVSEAHDATVEIRPPVDLSAELARLESERDQTRAELSAEVQRMHAERDRMRLELERLEHEKNRAAAEVDDLREAFAEAAAEAEEVRDRHRAELAAIEEELKAERATVARLTAELAAGPELPPPRTPSARRWGASRPRAADEGLTEEDRFAAAFAGDERVAADEPVEPPAREEDDPVEPPVGTEEPVEPPVGTEEPVEPPVSANGGTEEPVEPPVSANGGTEEEARSGPAVGDDVDFHDEAARSRPAAGDDVDSRNEAARRAAAAASPTQPLTPVDSAEDEPLPAIMDAASVPGVLDPPGPLRAGARPASQPGVEDGARPSRVPAWLRRGRPEATGERPVGPVFQSIRERVEGLFASNGNSTAEQEEDETADYYVPPPRRSAAAARARAGATVAARRSPTELWAARVLAALLVAVLLIAFLLILTSIA